MRPHHLYRLSRRTLLKGTAGLPAIGLTAPAPAHAQPGGHATPAPSQGWSIPELVAGNTTFALDLYGELARSTAGNLVFSPYSISEALAMVYGGARGETAAQMAEAMSFTLGQSALHEAFHRLTSSLTRKESAEAGEDAPALHLASALWGERTYPFSETYSAQIEQYYGAGLQPADFINAPQTAGEEINAWVAEHTEDRIQNIVPEGAVTPNTRLALANAIQFSGRWFEEFNPAEPRDDTFHRLDGTTATVPFMAQHSWFDYARGEGYQAIQLPYLVSVSDPPSRFAFIVLVPDDGNYAAFEEGLDTVALDMAIGQLDDTEVYLFLPKFEFEAGADLMPLLQAMGMVDVFDAAQADLSGMIDPALPSPEVGGQPLVLDLALHKAFIHVDEEGTEAAAATYSGSRPTAAPPTEPVEFRIDRPFLFAIRDTETGTLLFLGRMLDPSA